MPLLLNGQRYPDDGASANGFGRRHLREDEARLLYEAAYSVPPDMRVPGAWRLSADSVPVPPPPTGTERREDVACICSKLPENAPNLPRYAPDSNTLWRRTSNAGTPTNSPTPTGSSHAAAATPRVARNGGASPTACWRLSSSALRAATCRGLSTYHHPPSPATTEAPRRQG
ncbi:hypothetical protein D1007_40575 [Hordeum vulgare]|nr:hypothetical protein D1007_40575 [Hordeum vulgare]